ncbi:hypothetical protein T265_07965 [Opisthorchis viverrini]|uniref:Uncharacterized protein n=1 Tax=Opisthorchis viverrini TaxID=6198 RepID=A0A074ZFF4_OPIVI|nr:hypothetical protein T265_07965 [Opisthorchis viverrini]KER24367.1 hypothetical protein T265_07965 [Opisthorchis viverrini]
MSNSADKFVTSNPVMVGHTFWLKERINDVISFEFLGPLFIIPPIVLCGALSSLATVLMGTLVFLFVLSASISVILTAHQGLVSPVDLFCSQIPSGLKVFLSKSTPLCRFHSSPRCLYGIMVVTSLLWYVTLMVPVNIEEKLTVMEIVSYHLLLYVVYRLWRQLKSKHQDNMLHFDLAVPLAKSRSSPNFWKSSVHEETLTATPDTPPLTIPIIAPSRLRSPLSQCVDSRDIPWFMGLLSVHLFYAVYTANLALTSVCTPLMYLDWFILPNDCSTVYATLHGEFVTSVCTPLMYLDCAESC